MKERVFSQACDVRILKMTARLLISLLAVFGFDYIDKKFVTGPKNGIINNINMTKYFLIILTVSFLSCKGQSQKISLRRDLKDPIQLIQENEKKSIEKRNDNLGELVATILFKVKTDNRKDFEDGFIPWASIEKPMDDIPNLYNNDEIVIRETSIKIILDYPVTNQYEFTLISEKGFTRQQLLLEISNHYFKLYEEEEKSATIKTVPIEKRTTMYNRNQTNGKFGIWGHDIADLDLSEIMVYKTADEKFVLTLAVES